MLPTFNMTGKNVTPERQMAMMRTYLNELKDNTESELYDIKWENLSKPLREKIDSLESYQASNDEMVNYIKANSITANDITANFIASRLFVGEQAQFVSAVSTQFTSAIAKIGYITTDAISASYIKTTLLNAGGISANLITSDTMSADRVWSTNLSTKIANAGYITAGYITASVITSEINNANNAYFNNLQVTSGGLKIRVGANTYPLTVRSINSGGNTIYFLGTTTEPK